MTDILKTDFQGVREYDSLTCPSNQLLNNQCVINVESDLFFCADKTFQCAQETKISPELFINQDLYISHRITSPGFENWGLSPDIIQFYNLAAGYF
jgi:hypothetical protein